MLPKKIRLTTSLFDQVFKTGRVQHSKSFWMRSVPTPINSPSRFAVAISKKVAPTAVLRNKIKRIVYRAIEISSGDSLTGQSGVAMIFGVKKDISQDPFTEIVKEIQELLLNKVKK